MGEKKSVSDFRYDSGEAKVSWAAVGEIIRQDEIMGIVKLLLNPAAGREADYSAQVAKVAAEIAKLASVGKPAGKLSLGNQVQAVEAKVAEYLGAKYATLLTNCTAGFEIVHQYAGLKAGDEVIVPAITFIATMAYPLSVGAKVVFADVDPRTMNMDPKDVARKITPKTKVIMPVHIGGYPVDMDAIMELANKHNITVIEDAAHGFGGSYKGKMLGTIGHFGAFSFHEVKNITSLGEGGILCTNLDFGQEFSKCRFLGLDPSKQIKNWLYDVVAVQGKDGVFVPGNHSSTEVQALCLSAQMDRLNGIIEKRRKAAEYLNQRFGEVDGIITPPLDDADVKSSYHLYLFQLDPAKVGGDIQALKPLLQKRGIVQIPHFGPLYKFSVLRQLGYDTDAIQASCPVTEEAFNHRFTHLPLYDFTDDQLKYMADAVIDAVKELKAAK
jgi:dTDP-4-amino-4,6-dideoxygalactose transaminase